MDWRRTLAYSTCFQAKTVRFLVCRLSSVAWRDCCRSSCYCTNKSPEPASDNRLGCVWAGDGFLHDLHGYEIASKTWTDLSTPAAGTMPQARRGFGFCEFDGRLYVYGGSFGNCKHIFFLSFTAYRACSACRGVAAGFLVCVHGHGAVRMTRCLADGQRLKDLHEYDIASRTWTDLSSPITGTAPNERYWFGFAELDGRLYVLGGYNGNVPLWQMQGRLPHSPA